MVGEKEKRIAREAKGAQESWRGRRRRQNKWEWKRWPGKAGGLKGREGGRRKKEESIGQWASILLVPPLLIL